jgi:hypothetical protein
VRVTPIVSYVAHQGRTRESANGICFDSAGPVHHRLVADIV